MKYKEIVGKTKDELQKVLGETKDKIRDLNFKIANRSLKNVRELRNAKRTIARVKTVLNKK